MPAPPSNVSSPPAPSKVSLPPLPLSLLAKTSPVSVSAADPPITFSMLRMVSSARPPTLTVALAEKVRVTTTASVFSA